VNKMQLAQNTSVQQGFNEVSRVALALLRDWGIRPALMLAKG
jgi:hypothetical protein